MTSLLRLGATLDLLTAFFINPQHLSMRSECTTEHTTGTLQVCQNDASICIKGDTRLAIAGHHDQAQVGCSCGYVQPCLTIYRVQPDATVGADRHEEPIRGQHDP